jgi:hypothetical protein
MDEKLKYKIRSAVDILGIDQSLVIFGKDILKQVYIDNPISFLNQFNSLRPVEKDREIYYVDNDNHPLFYFYKERQEKTIGFCYINIPKIWLFFVDVMDYNKIKIQRIIKEWLGTTYNLGELLPSPRMVRHTIDF